MQSIGLSTAKSLPLFFEFGPCTDLYDVGSFRGAGIFGEVACARAAANSRSSTQFVEMPDPTSLGET